MEVRFDGVKKTDPTNHEGFQVNYAAPKRAGFRWRWRFMVLLVISPILIWGWLVLQEEILVRADGILTTEPIHLSASDPGFVTSVPVALGDSVSSGQLLLELSSPEIDRKIKHWSGNLEELKIYQDQMIANLKETLGVYTRRLEESRRKQDRIAARYQQLAEKGLFKLADQMQLNEMRRALSHDERQHIVDLERLESLRYTHDLADEIRAIELEIAVAEVQQQQLDTRANRDGVINRVFVKEGEYVTEGAPLVELSNYDAPVVNVFLQPESISSANVGNAVVVIFPDRTRYHGVVKEPPQIAETIPAALAGPFEGSKRAIKVVVALDQEPDTWVEGLPVKVRFK
ncbi:HlyD family efflux transporter periplasmic adaptor subunit (plasmid) [Rhodobacteraceae bacterium M382]|nr:HlyD family efflux transporter periplasmic adaptor subunit [Rhodobacteraceae bacterium M382]